MARPNQRAPRNEGKSLPPGLLSVLLPLALGCASPKAVPASAQPSRFAGQSALDSAKPRRLADSSQFSFELSSVYYDWRSTDERGPVARFRFRNLSKSVLPVYGIFLTRRDEHPLVGYPTALRSTCSLLESEDRTLAVNPASRVCWPNTIDLLPNTDYTIDAELLQFAPQGDASAVGSVSIAGPEKMFTSATFPLDRLVSLLPERRHYPPNGDLPIPDENRFVMSFDAVRDLEKLGGSRLSKEAYFAPSAVETLDANRAILRSLVTAEGSELRCGHDGCREFIMNFLDQYCVQYWGRIGRSPGRRTVEANFFLCRKRELENDHPERRSQIVSVKGGGAAYWSASYDIENKKLVSLYSNSPE